MMLKKKNSHWVRLKYVSILPLAALAVVLFARPEVSSKLDEISAVKVSDFTSINEVNVESFANVLDVAKEKPKKVAVTKEDDKAEQVKSQLPEDSLIFHLIKSQSPEDLLKNIDTHEIYLKYLQNRLFEVCRINDSLRQIIRKGDVSFKSTDEYGGTYTSCDLQIYDVADSTLLRTKEQLQNRQNFRFPKNLLYIVDGVEISNPSAMKLKTEDIYSISVLKDAAATSVYGDKGANGVILISTKKGIIKD